MTRALIGTDPDQVPLNRHLGDLSRMNGDELAQQIGGALTQRLAGTGLGAVNDLRNTVFERGAPADVFGTGMTVGLARAGSDGVGVPGIGTGEFGALIINAQWTDSSIGPAYSRQFFRSGRMWFQAMKSATAWDTWAEVLTSGAKAVAALSTIGSVAADQIAFFTGTGTAGTTSLSPLARTLIANTDLSSMLSTLGLVGLGASADLRGNVYEKGPPSAVYGKGTMVGLARGGSDGLAIPEIGSASNAYGTLIVFAGWNDASGGAAINRMFLRGGRVWTQPMTTGTAWGTWTEMGAGGGGGKYYESPQVDLTMGGAYTFAHGLGSVPKFVQAYLICTQAYLDYAVGDRVALSPGVTVGYDGSNRGNFFNAFLTDATTIKVTLGLRAFLPCKTPDNAYQQANNIATTGGASCFKLIVAAGA